MSNADVGTSTPLEEVHREFRFSRNEKNRARYKFAHLVFFLENSCDGLEELDISPSITDEMMIDAQRRMSRALVELSAFAVKIDGQVSKRIMKKAA
jgi:hypothetical protein